MEEFWKNLVRLRLNYFYSTNITNDRFYFTSVIIIKNFWCNFKFESSRT